MEPFALIGCQALYRFRPMIAELRVFTAMVIAPNCLARAMLARQTIVCRCMTGLMARPLKLPDKGNSKPGEGNLATGTLTIFALKSIECAHNPGGLSDAL